LLCPHTRASCHQLRQIGKASMHVHCSGPSY
jgi:hypothetical protein